jgi:mannitol/fructose-specific phosphotransferase system IIA component
MRRLLPGFLDRVVLRLQAADSNNPDLEEQMYIEDEYLKALIDRDNKITYLGLKLEEKSKDLEEKNKALEEKNKMLEEASKVLANQQQIILDYAQRLKTEGNSTEIQSATGLSFEIIEKL